MNLRLLAPFAIVLCLVIPLRGQELPQDAQVLIEENRKAVAEIERKAMEQTQAAHEALQAKLEKLKVDYTKEGKLDEAVAIRDYLRAGVGAKILKPLVDPGVLTAYRSEVGRVLLFEVVGQTGSTIYGTDVYTHDSTLATAVVHAGILKPGERGIVKVTILPPQDEFRASGRNGVSSTRWTSSDYECYKIEPAKVIGVVSAQPAPALAGSLARQEPRKNPGNLMGYRDQAGMSIVFEVTGADDQIIYGTDTYSDDSPLDVAVVHAGLLRVNQSGLVKVTLLGPQEKFEATSRNGVVSHRWNAWPGSYKVEVANELDAVKEAVKEIKPINDALNKLDAIKDALKK